MKPTSLRGIAKRYREDVECEASHFEEPRAVIPHARICEGTVGQPTVLPRCNQGFPMKKYLIICFIAITYNSVFADDAGFKEQTLRDYEGRCKEVLGQKGFQQKLINLECACEVEIIDKHFSTFKLLIMGAKAVAGKELLSEEETKVIKLNLSECKKTYLK
jgi:hypothetical protein